MTVTIGLVGIGNIGLVIAQNLIGAGHRVVGYRRTMMEKFIAIGGEAGTSPQDVAEKADVLLTSLPSREALHEVFCGPEGILSANRKGLDVFELSTISLKAKLSVRDVARSSNVILLDCTISGNPVYISARNATIFVGGDRKVFDRWVLLLRDITDKVTWMGQFGTGRVAKFVALYLVAAHTLVAAEAFELATRAGLDRTAMFEAIKGSNATSAMLESRGALMVNRDYKGYDTNKRRESKATQTSSQIPSRGMDNRVRQINRLVRLASLLGGKYPLMEAMNSAYDDAVKAQIGVYDIAEVFEFLMANKEESVDFSEVLALLDQMESVIDP